MLLSWSTFLCGAQSWVRHCFQQLAWSHFCILQDPSFLALKCLTFRARLSILSLAAFQRIAFGLNALRHISRVPCTHFGAARSNFTAAFLSEPYTAPNFSPPDKVYDPLSAFAHFAYLSWRIFWSSISCISSLLKAPQFPSLFSRHLQKQWGWWWHCDRWHLFDYIPGRRVAAATPLQATISVFTLGG